MLLLEDQFDDAEVSQEHRKWALDHLKRPRKAFADVESLADKILQRLNSRFECDYLSVDERQNDPVSQARVFDRSSAGSGWKTQWLLMLLMLSSVGSGEARPIVHSGDLDPSVDPFPKSRFADAAALNEELNGRYGAQYRKRFGRELFLASESNEFKLVDFMHRRLSPEAFAEFCNGGQIRLPFNGKLFEWLKGLGAEARRSSHYRNIVFPTAFEQVPGQHFGIDGKFLPTVLFGLIERNGKQYMYIQSERNSYNPSAPVSEKLRHIKDAATYVNHGVNQGPFGDSNYTDAHPMGDTENPPPTWFTRVHPLKRPQAVALNLLHEVMEHMAISASAVLALAWASFRRMNRGRPLN